MPEDWSTNALRCGTATKATVVVDVTAINLCYWAAPETYDNVWIEPGVNGNLFDPAEDFEIDGVAAQRDEITCTPPGQEPASCTGTVFLPSVHASYRAQAATAERVDEILSWIHIVSDRVAVPGFHQFNDRYQDVGAGEHYRNELAAAGIRVEVSTTVEDSWKPGWILDVSPAPGTMIQPGDVVHMTEVTAPDDAADTTPGKPSSGAGGSLPPASADLQRVAELFVKFAKGELPGVPADTPIDLYIGGVLTKTIASDQQQDPQSWQSCPEAGSYAARTCPISAVAPLAAWPGQFAFTSAPPAHPCANPMPLPASLRVYQSVTVTPDANLDCASYFAVQLLVNDVGQIVAANVVWAEP